MMEVNHWHRFVYLFLEEELSIEDIVRFWFIATHTGVIDDDLNKLVGINVLDNSLLYEALILGMIRAYPEGKFITYPELAENMNKHFNTVGKAVKRMLAKDLITRTGITRHGAIYTVVDDTHLSKWMIEFTEALVQVQTDEELKKAVYADAESRNIGFRRGFQVLKDEIKAKIWPK